MKQGLLFHFFLYVNCWNRAASHRYYVMHFGVRNASKNNYMLMLHTHHITRTHVRPEKLA